MRAFLVVTIIAASLVASPAHADWKYARWGMSADDVVAASAGGARRLSDEQARAESTFVGRTCSVQSQGPHVIGDVTFNKVNFCFDAKGRLASVDLYSGPADFGKLELALAAAFGAPALSEDGYIPTRIYNDAGHANSLRLIRVSSTILQYTPIPTGF